jgi:catechol 2,3-dioxygenase-like lactoylglutathione lyase family enzyme
MPGHWRFLELSLPTPDIGASLDFYRCLGFTELNTSDIRPYPYVVLTDGRIAIGLHGDQLPVPALSFVQSGAATWARQLEAAGFELAFKHLGIDDFHEFALVSPSGHLALVAEAPTFSRLQIDEASAPLTGASAYIQFGCYDLDACVQFWNVAGLAEDAEDEGIDPLDPEAAIQVEGEELVEDDEGTDSMRALDEARETGPDEIELAAPHLRLRLSLGHDNTPRLNFPTPDVAGLHAAAERFGLQFRAEGKQKVLKAPEGTLLTIDLV